ncbi:Lrp/AsnC ligand binding domain-containing protein [Streptomyces monashensis]|uniref:Lrp/AsnC ligand binding domain-containing protein n=1 Tax=Streptomyces monashensis TaxID=1678012 RepID=UPI00340F28A7
MDCTDFEERLPHVPQVFGAMLLTGDYDCRLRVACTDAREFEAVVIRLKADFGVRESRSRLLLHEVPLGPDRPLEP